MTEYHVGRLIDHVHFRVTDLERSARFYRAVLSALDPAITVECGDGWVAADELFLSDDGPPSSVHIAFQAADEQAVQRFHAAGLAAGGRDHGAPGERPYHPGYYAAYVLDPDGYNIEAVYHGPLTRSAPSVVLTPVSIPPS